GHQADLAGLDLQAEVFRVDAALGEAAGDEPQARLRRAHEHVAQLIPGAKAPDRPDPVGDGVTEQLPDQNILAHVAGRQHDQVGGQQLATFHARAFGDEPGDVGKLHQANLAAHDQVRAADVEIVTAAARQILELPAGAVVAEVEPE